MKKLIFLLPIFISTVMKAQFNLVPNPSFEVYDTCPNWTGQIEHAIPWTNPLFGLTPDYFNVCDTSANHFFGVPDNYVGHQFAHSGSAYAEIVTAWFPANPVARNYREYIQVELSDSLIGGVNYCLRFYVSACDSCHYISNNMGMYFSQNAVLDTCPGPGCIVPLPLTPQFENSLNNNLNDRFGWTEIAGSYLASGGEKFIIIGNFHDTTSTITTYTGWSNPNSNAFDHAVYYIDDILVTPCDSLSGNDDGQLNEFIHIFPNPFHDILNLEFKDEIIHKVTLIDALGRIIMQRIINGKKQVQIDLSHISDALYILKISTIHGFENYKLIKN